MLNRVILPFYMLLPFMLLVITDANASGRSDRHASGYPDFSMHLEYSRIDWTFETDASTIQASQSLAGLSIAEPLSHWLTGRLSAGRVAYKLDGAAQDERFDPDGRYWSLALEPHIEISRRFTVGGAIAYRYLKAEDQLDGEVLSYTYQQVHSEINAITRLSNTLSVVFGVSDLWGDGRRRFAPSTGTSTSSDFTNQQSTSGLVRLLFHVGKNDLVALTLSDGAQESFSIIFKSGL